MVDEITLYGFDFDDRPVWETLSLNGPNAVDFTITVQRIDAINEGGFDIMMPSALWRHRYWEAEANGQNR